MSDSAPVAAVADTAAAPSGPTSTAEIAANVIEQAEHESADTPAYGETPAAETRLEAEIAEPAQRVAEPAPVELTPSEKFLTEQGHQAKKVDGRDTWLPYKTVAKMLDRYQSQHRSTWDGERGVFEGQVKELSGHIDSLRSSVAGDPVAFLTELANVDPRYRAFLDKGGQAEPQRAAAPAGASMPEPDLTLPDGSKTYSLDGLRSLLEWNTSQVESRLLPKVDERMKPYTDREQQAKQREVFDRQMADAQAWPMFGAMPADGTLTPFQAEVLQELKQDTEQSRAAKRRPSMTLRQAYLEVYARHQDPAKVRERLLADMKTAPKAPALTRQSTENTRPMKPASTAEIARNVISQMERGA